MEEIKELISQAIGYIKRLFVRIINGVINFINNIVGWFKGLHLKQEEDIPFVINAKDPQFREMLRNAPQKNVGIFEGVYNESTEEITHHEYLAADAIDNQTRQVMGNESIVVLS